MFEFFYQTLSNQRPWGFGRHFPQAATKTFGKYAALRVPIAEAGGGSYYLSQNTLGGSGLRVQRSKVASDEDMINLTRTPPLAAFSV
jgi:hypothetical protein